MGIHGQKHQMQTSKTQFRRHTVNLISLVLTLGSFWYQKALFSFLAYQISFSFFHCMICPIKDLSLEQDFY